ncbi:MAG: transposase, partial [Nitrosomonas sp.]|nr:transposase [Nitrosomonas sp.]
MWAYRSNDFESGPRIIVFDYWTSRSSEAWRNCSDGWQRPLLLVDDYGGLQGFILKTASPALNWGAGRTRRKFFDLHQANARTVA